MHGRALLDDLRQSRYRRRARHQLVYCAGAIADLYAAAGGDVLYAGKPHRPIYEGALACAQKMRGRPSIIGACWRSGIRCGPISRARSPSGSNACS